MTEAFSGSYPIESRGGEIERLHIQSAAMVPDTERMLELIGVREGWSCLDIGCGPGGIVGLLCKRVGSTGRVVGLDMNIGFLEHARATAPSNVEFVVADAYGSNLPAGTFDLVHMRFVASTSGAPERLLQEAKRLARPGGTIVVRHWTKADKVEFYRGTVCPLMAQSGHSALHSNLTLVSQPDKLSYWRRTKSLSEEGRVRHAA